VTKIKSQHPIAHRAQTPKPWGGGGIHKMQEKAAFTPVASTHVPTHSVTLQWALTSFYQRTFSNVISPSQSHSPLQFHLSQRTTKLKREWDFFFFLTSRKIGVLPLVLDSIPITSCLGHGRPWHPSFSTGTKVFLRHREKLRLRSALPVSASVWASTAWRQLSRTRSNSCRM
jgi:hypothetical protein